MEWHVRRVVTGVDDNGKEAVLSDGAAPGRSGGEARPAVATAFWVGHRPRAAVDGGEEPEPLVLEPPVGGIATRVIRLPPPPAGANGDERWLRVAGEPPDRPGMHTTDTLDLMVVLDGQIVLGLDDGEYSFGPGDVAVQRGTAHRWRVAGDRPCTYAVTMIRPDPTIPPLAPPLEVAAGAGDPDAGLRRVVTGARADGTSFAVASGPPPAMHRPAGPGGVGMVDLWQTGGPVGHADQGGDVPGDWSLDPAGLGIAFRVVEWPPGSDTGSRGWHATPSIDIDFIVEGELELEVRNSPAVRLGPGDIVVQRGVEHLWRPVGDRRVRMAAVMIGLPRAG